MEPKVSIIVPVYNAEKSLARCVDSILNQEFRDFELILMDDGSKDRSGEICDGYARADARVVVVHKENTGVSDTRNQAIARARGTFLQFVDSDDHLAPDFTQRMVTAAEQHDATLVISPYWMEIPRDIQKEQLREKVKASNPEDIAKKKLRRKKPEVEYREYGFLPAGVYDQKSYALHLMEKPVTFFYNVVWNKLYRRDLIQMAHIRFEHVVYAEDQLFNTRYLQVAQRFAAIDEAAYCYIQNPQSVCHTQVSAADMLRHRSRMYHTYKELCIQLGVYDKFRLRLHGIYLSLFESPLPNGPVQKLSDAFARTHSRI